MACRLDSPSHFTHAHARTSILLPIYSAGLVCVWSRRLTSSHKVGDRHPLSTPLIVPVPVPRPVHYLLLQFSLSFSLYRFRFSFFSIGSVFASDVFGRFHFPPPSNPFSPLPTSPFHPPSPDDDRDAEYTPDNYRCFSLPR